MDKRDIKTFSWLALFAIAMAFVETTVVVYLRKLYYPQGFNFPLNITIPSDVIFIETVREICTIIMLLMVAFLAAKKIYQKFAYFIFAFAVWDIFYYIWLKVLIAWPSSLLTQDLLFLIPVPWMSPVLSPVLVSLSMIVLSFIIVNFSPKKIRKREWFLLILGSVIIFISFIWDHTFAIIKDGFISKFSNAFLAKEFMNVIFTYIPSGYTWTAFLLGEVIALFGVYLIYRNAKKDQKELRREKNGLR
ncbi:MAG: hypothetical protein NTX24_02260 [Candidatus Pacearchaeota archaeon]|nr:hypothetical protein [Candidatus Pacearchaeota archaeon]